MVTHMKTTIEIADALLIRAKARARARKITLRSLIEQSLAETLENEDSDTTVKPVVFGGNGLGKEFEGASWDKIREAIYQ